MRVLFWAESFLPDLGGVQVFAGHLLPHLKETYGHEFCVVCCTGAGVSTSEQWAGIPVNRFPFHSALLSRNLKLVADLRRAVDRLFRDVQPDLIHVNTTGPSLFFLQGHLRQPCLTTMHELILARDSNSVLGRLLKSSRQTVTVSQSILNDLRGFLPEVSKRAKVVYCGLPSFSLEPTPLPFGPPQFVCLGRLAEQKGFDLAIEALGRLRDNGITALLSICGGGADLDRLQTLTRSLGLNDLVRFPGALSPNEVPAAINRSTAVVIPSRKGEGFGLTAVEAGLMRRPVLAAWVGGVPEAVLDGQTGLLFKPEDSQGLAELMRRLIDTPGLAERLGDCGFSRAQASFSIDRCAAAYDALYQQVGGAAN